MLMATWGGGRVLMTYLQWRSLDGLACPSKNSCEIRRNNRRAVVMVEGGRRGGFAAAEALHSNGRFCLEWGDPPPHPTPTPSLPPQHPKEGGRERGERCYRVLAARASTCSWIPNVAEDQKSELSLFCQVCHDKMLGRTPPPHPTWPPPPVCPTPPYTHAGELTQQRDLLVWPANHLCINTKTHVHRVDRIFWRWGFLTGRWSTGVAMGIVVPKTTTLTWIHKRVDT